MISKLPAKYLIGLKDAIAVVRNLDDGYILELVVDDTETTRKVWQDITFRKTVEKMLLSWMANHPDMHAIGFKGFVLIFEDPSKFVKSIPLLISELDATLESYIPVWRF